MSLAIYRKYRPRKFSDILGQELTVQILQEAAKQNKLAHAYIFAGPRGTGKTTVARLLSKIANCVNRTIDENFRKKGEPCNSCVSCEEIDDGRSLDVIEIDAASNRGIDEIRDLKENVRVASTHGRFKIFIIDEAHMLTKDAFNALLKTLEEPPPYVILILATTEIEKIPPTIISRAQKFYFKRAAFSQIAEKLKQIAEIEEISIDKEALDLIATSAEGSFRDAESLLDQLIAFGDKNITLPDVENTLGKIGFDKLSDFCGLLLESDIKKSLQTISEIENGGYNIVQFTKDVIAYLRRTAVLSFNPEMEKKFETELMNEHLNKIVAHAALFHKSHLNLIKNLISAYSQMRYSQFPIVPFEVAIIESLKN